MYDETLQPTEGFVKTPPQANPIQKKWVVVILALIMFTNTMDFMVLMPLGPKLISLFKITPQQFSFLVSAYSLTAGIFGLIGSLLFDRVDRKHALIGCYTGFLIGTLSCAFSPNYMFLLISRSIAGAFGGLLSGICFAIITDLFSIHERGTALGKLMTSFSLAAIIGVPFGLILANHLGWHSTFISIAIMGAIGLLLVQTFVPNVRSHLQNVRAGLFSGISDNLKDPNSRKALLTTFLMVLSQFVVIPFISAFLVANTDFPESELPLLYLLGGAFTAVTGPLVGRLCDRYGAQHVFTKTGVLFLIPVFLITHLTHAPVWLTLFISTAFFVFSNSRMVPAMTIISSSIPSNRRGSFMSLNACLQQLGSASASFMGGWFVTQSAVSTEFVGFHNTAYLSAFFGVFAYYTARKIRSIS